MLKTDDWQVEGSHRPAQCPMPQADGCHWDKQVCGREMGEKEKPSGSCAVEISGTGDEKVVRNRLIWVAYTVTWGHVCPSLYCH